MTWQWGVLCGQAGCVTILYLVDPTWLRSSATRRRDHLGLIASWYIVMTLTLEVGALATMGTGFGPLVPLVLGLAGECLISIAATILFAFYLCDQPGGDWLLAFRAVTGLAVGVFLFWSWTAPLFTGSIQGVLLTIPVTVYTTVMTAMYLRRIVA